MNEATRRTSAQSVPPVGQRELTVVLLVGGVAAILVLAVGSLVGTLSGSQAWAAAFAGVGLLGLSVGFRTTQIDIADTIHRLREGRRADAATYGRQSRGSVAQARVHGALSRDRSTRPPISVGPASASPAGGTAARFSR